VVTGRLLADFFYVLDSVNLPKFDYWHLIIILIIMMRIQPKFTNAANALISASDRNFFSLFLNVSREMSVGRKSHGRLFHTVGPLSIVMYCFVDTPYCLYTVDNSLQSSVLVSLAKLTCSKWMHCTGPVMCVKNPRNSMALFHQKPL